MKRYLLLLSLIIKCQLINAQSTSNNTYAVIIGISEYENKNIDQLNFAHKDAQAFYNYLQSAAGGKVPAENIKFLQNKTATCAAIYSAMDWILKSCEKGDVVYFYFSGHGDIEQSTIHQLGFLLSYNTPKGNYMNNAVRIEDVNMIANTLSAKTEAKVIIITDACHSGKLTTTDNTNSKLVGQQLKNAVSNEIRITSCAPDELSAENENWGGGRGVFSYYLMNGLMGLADSTKDGKVSLKELQGYVDAEMANDLFLKPNKQTPIFMGAQNFTLAQVDNATLKKIRTTDSLQQSASVNIVPIGKPLPQYFFDAIDTLHIENIFDFNTLSTLPKEEIPTTFINMLIKKDAIVNDNSKLQKLLMQVNTNTIAKKNFVEKLTVMLCDRGQEIINLYLVGDEVELEKRRYYNSKNNSYDVYVKMFNIALQLVTPGTYLERELKIKQLYFSGLAARLKISTAVNSIQLIETAFSLQHQAVNLEDNAAFIHNELGILYKLKGDMVNAEKEFVKATQIAANWALPYSNLMSIYNKKGEWVKSKKAAEKTFELQKNYDAAYINASKIYENENNYLLSEDLLNKAQAINNKSYLAYENLGAIYLRTTKYAAANKQFEEAYNRKKGFFTTDVDMDGVPDILDNIVMTNGPIFYNCGSLENINANDAITFLVAGHKCYKEGNEDSAIYYFRKAIDADTNHPLAYHYLANLYANQTMFIHESENDKKYYLQQAEMYYQLAIQKSVSEVEQANYLKKYKNKITRETQCFSKYFSSCFYDPEEDRYELATIQKTWLHYTEVVETYQQLIKNNPSNLKNYKLLADYLENNKQYLAVEKVLQQLEKAMPNQGKDQLFSFYNRLDAMNDLPQKAMWLQKAGDYCSSFISINNRKQAYYYSAISKDLQGEREYEKMLFNIEDRMNDEGGRNCNQYFPISDAIYFYNRALPLLQESDEHIASLNYKIATYYHTLLMYDLEFVYFKKYLQLIPNDASVCQQLAAIADSTKQMQEAFVQLDNLNQTNSISMQYLPSLANYYMLAGLYTKADTALSKIEKNYPIPSANWKEQRGKLNLLSNQYTTAIAQYQSYLKAVPNDINTLYSIARLYAKTNNEMEAINYLGKALENGFKNTYVLQVDDCWSSYKQKENWKNLLTKYKLELPDYRIN